MNQSCEKMYSIENFYFLLQLLQIQKVWKYEKRVRQYKNFTVTGYS